MQFKQNTWVIPYDMTLAVVKGQGGVKRVEGPGSQGAWGKGGSEIGPKGVGVGRR